MSAKENKVESVKAEIVNDQNVEVVEKKDTKETEKAYKQMITRIQKNQRKLEEDSIIFFWHIGEEVETLMTTAKYGSKTVAQFATDIGRSRSQVYNYARLHKTYSISDIKEKFLAREIGLRQIILLLETKDDKTRQELEKKLLAGQLSPAQLSKAVRDANKALEAASKEPESFSEKEAEKGKAEDDIKLSRALKGHCESFEVALGLMEKSVKAMEKVVNDVGNIGDDELYYSVLESVESVWELANTVWNKYSELTAQLQDLFKNEDGDR